MPDSDTGEDGNGHNHPQWLPIPSRAIAVVEHPCIVKNADKGIDSLGGPVKLSKGLRSQKVIPTAYEEDEEPIQLISVSLRPHDPFAKRLLSTAVTTNNLLLKVTVPRRTGRKRKRGSSGPFLPVKHSNTTSQSRAAHVDAPTIYRSLQDNPSAYKIALVGILDETHRFRAMPDLQYSATHNDSMVQLRDHVLPVRYDQLKKYNLNTEPGAMNTKSIGPSAEFLQMPIAYNYQFQQNTYVKYTDEGVVNLQKRVAYNSYTIIRPTDRTVPTGPKSSLPSEQSLTPYLQSLVTQIRKELDKRPIITRHLLYNKLGWDKRTRLRQAAVYCGFFFESGPWREALIKWGVDPRKDPKYRQYQTISFLSYLKTGRARHHKTFDEHVQRLSQMSKEELEHEHVFDGKTVSTTGNLFQFCDITDPLIAKILATNNIRSTCAPTFQGWYHVGTWAKATVILKDKMNTILGGETPDDAIYARIASWPEIWDDKEMAATYKAEVDNRQVHQEKKKEHEVMHNVRWAARNPRYTFENMEQGEGQRNQVEQTEEEGIEDAEIPEDMTEIPDTADVILNEGESGASPSRYTQDEDEADASTGDDEDAEGEREDEDYDDEVPVVLNRADGSGPAPFGGLFSM